MPAHYSYRDTAAINRYYGQALEILGTGPSPDWQRDTLRQISDTQYPYIGLNLISDVEIITADYLIHSIDQAFKQWRTRPWAKHLTYEEFRDWILPYKVTELQSLDAWRDTLINHYSDSINTIIDSDDQRNTIYGAIEIVRDEIHTKQSAIGHRIIWEDRGGIPMRSASTWVRMTYGTCLDYVTMGTAVFRSMGLPASIDYVPSWGRNSDGHSWYVFPDDRGREQVTVNSLILGAGIPFYTYERVPKVWRKSYLVNREIVKYRNTAKFVYPFELCEHDVTDLYNLTSDLKIQTNQSVRRQLKDKKYVYIAMAVNSNGPQWKWIKDRVLLELKSYDLFAESCSEKEKRLNYIDDFMMEYGRVLSKIGLVEKSDSVLKVCQSYQSSPGLLILLGENCMNRGDYCAAENYFIDAFVMLPDRIKPLYELANLYVLKGDTVAALNVINSANNYSFKIESGWTRDYRIKMKTIENRITNSILSNQE